MSKSVLIIGANGRLGQMLARAFLADGWQVMGQIRRQPPSGAPAGILWIYVPASDPSELATAAGAADVVVHAANPPYPKWPSQALSLAQNAIETARSLNALLMFPGNVYNFREPMPDPLLETTLQHPTTRKGRIRMEIENALKEAAEAGVRSVIIRAGDFFGGPGRGSWFDLVIAKSLPRGRVVYPGPTNVVHAWAYLPDLARAFVTVAERRNDLAGFEVFHFPGHSLTGEDLLEGLSRSARRVGVIEADTELRRGTFPWPIIRVGGVLVPMWRELAEMRYLWYAPHRLSGERLAQFIGAVPMTPVDQALEETLRVIFKSDEPAAESAR